MNNTDPSFCDSCTKKCAFVSYDKTYHCVSEEIYYFCYDGLPNFFALAAALIAFNLIIYALALIKGGYHSHIYFLIHSFLQNIAIAIAITGIICMKGISYEVWHIIVILLGFIYSFFFPALQSFICISCLNKCFNFDYEYKLLHQLFERKEESLTLSTLKNKVRANPPLIVVNATYSEYYNKKTHHHESNYIIPYVSWKLDYPSGDDTNNQENQKPYLITIKNEFNITPNLLVATNEKAQEVERDLGGEDSYRQKIINMIYNVDDILIFPGDSCFVNMCNSDCCNLFYILFNCFGFGTVQVNIYGLFLNRATIYTKRSLSDTDEYPNQAFEPDPSFGQIGESVPESKRVYTSE